MPRKSSVNSIDVARLAGVSQSAVSRAFSKVPTQSSVSAQTKERIFEAAQKLGYRPNALARSMKLGRSNIVALLFSYLDNQFYALALEKLCLELQRLGFHALVFMQPVTDEAEKETVAELLEYKVDGIITASVELSSTLCEFCLDHNIPVVMFNRVQDQEGLSSVTTDNTLGGRLAARHLLQTGHQRIGLISGWSYASTSRDREWGFEAEMRDQGHDLFAKEIGHFDLSRTRQAIGTMMDRPAEDRPDGVFIVNDYMAIEAMSVIRHQLNLRISEDVSVIGFDDIPLASLPEFALTTLRQPINQMVSNACRLMAEAVASGTDDIENIALAPRLICRSSVAERQ